MISLLGLAALAVSPSLDRVCGPATDLAFSDRLVSPEEYELALERTMSELGLSREQRVEYRRDCVSYLIGARRALREIKVTGPQR